VQRYKIKIEYDGTPFVGWQFQKNGLSIQEVLQEAIFNFSKERTVVTGAGRTDSGVHALAQVAHFDLKKKFKKKNFLPGINQHIGNKSVTVLKINFSLINWSIFIRSNLSKITFYEPYTHAVFNINGWKNNHYTFHFKKFSKTIIPFFWLFSG